MVGTQELVFGKQRGSRMRVEIWGVIGFIFFEIMRQYRVVLAGGTPIPKARGARFYFAALVLSVALFAGFVAHFLGDGSAFTAFFLGFSVMPSFRMVFIGLPGSKARAARARRSPPTVDHKSDDGVKVEDTSYGEYLVRPSWQRVGADYLNF